MVSRSPFPPVVMVLLGALTGAGTADAQEIPRGAPSEVVLGAQAELGGGTVSSFARLDPEGRPLAIGILFSPGALEDLPAEASDGFRCHDRDGSGATESQECMGGHARVVPLPPQVSRRTDVPFRWMLVNWNPEGHAPPGIYTNPHFDIHYFMDSIERTFALLPGPCGPELIRCDQFERAVRPVPPNFLHPDFANVDAAAPAMGNHLVDLTSHEFHGAAFDRTWIYGSYDGRITFYEEMVTLAFLRGRPNACFDIKTAPAYEVAGYYPTRSCFRFDPASGEQEVSVQEFVYRDASPPLSASGGTAGVDPDPER